MRFFFFLFLLLLPFFSFAQNSRLKVFVANDMSGYKNAKGEIVIPAGFDIADEFNACGIASVVDAKGWRYIDTQGQTVVVPFLYDNGPDEFAEGLARFVDGGKFGFFDHCGKTVIPARFDFAAPFTEGLAAVCDGCQKESGDEHAMIVGGKWGYIDKSGAVVIPLRFEAAEPFDHGLARVKVSGTWGSIDQKGNIKK